MLEIHFVCVCRVDPAEIRHHLTKIVYSWFGFLVDFSGFPRCFQHDGSPESGAASIESKAHEIEISPSVFTVFGIRETKDLPIVLQLKTEIGLKIVGDSKSDLVQHFFVCSEYNHIVHIADVVGGVQFFLDVVVKLLQVPV